jgi:hypothetical protein
MDLLGLSEKSFKMLKYTHPNRERTRYFRIAGSPALTSRSSMVGRIVPITSMLLKQEGYGPKDRVSSPVRNRIYGGGRN